MQLGKLEGKRIVWFKKGNRYALFEPVMEKIIVGILQKVPVDKLIPLMTDSIHITAKEAEFLLTQVRAQVLKWNSKSPAIVRKHTIAFSPGDFWSSQSYLFHGSLCTIHYGDKFLYDEIHPKFAHYLHTTSTAHHHIAIFKKGENYVLNLNEDPSMEYTLDNFHFLQGKLSMFLTQVIYDKAENKWLGVFHATAINNGKRSAMLMGESGSGKSTALALLNANGFQCMADDFVPMDVKKCEIHSFPAAISIKENCISFLERFYKELCHSTLYGTRLNKSVTYIPIRPDFTKTFACHILIFIKYVKGARLTIEPVTKVDAFQKLVPESWLSKEVKHAELFVKWFNATTTYHLVYSESQSLISTVQNILDNDL